MQRLQIEIETNTFHSQLKWENPHLQAITADHISVSEQNGF